MVNWGLVRTDRKAFVCTVIWGTPSYSYGGSFETETGKQ